MKVGRLKRVAKVGAEASAATVQATLLSPQAKSYLAAAVTIAPRAEVAELADAMDSKSIALRGVWVRFPPSASQAAPVRA
jgi:hypothetical protein